MSKIYVMTQDYENYGSVEEPYWKPKGGSDYFITNFTGSTEQAVALVNSIMYLFNYNCIQDLMFTTIWRL